MLEEGSTPMTAHKTGTEAVLLGRKIGRDKGEDIQWNAVYGNEEVLPFTNARQCGRNIPVDLRDVVKSKAAEEVSVSSFKTSCHAGVSPQRTMESYTPRASTPRLVRRPAAGATGPFQGKCAGPWRDKKRWRKAWFPCPVCYLAW